VESTGSNVQQAQVQVPTELRCEVTTSIRQCCALGGVSILDPLLLCTTHLYIDLDSSERAPTTSICGRGTMAAVQPRGPSCTAEDVKHLYLSKHVKRAQCNIASGLWALLLPSRVVIAVLQVCFSFKHLAGCRSPYSLAPGTYMSLLSIRLRSRAF